MLRGKHEGFEDIPEPVDDITGKIKSIYCKNFVTYGECQFNPTRYLNMVIGPNGTGKSTLVAAIVLGLGGDPKLLSRASSIQDYIKNGQSNATISVEVYANNCEKNVIFERSFNKSGKSIYKVNEETITRNKFISEVSVYKIEISNLCQFLPQDCVQDFAKMQQQDVLINTISCVCSKAVINDYVKLKLFREKQLNGKKILRSDNQKLTDLKKRVEELKQILQSYNVQKQFEQKLEICNIKKNWLEAQEINVKISTYETDLIIARDKLKVESDTLQANTREHNNTVKITANLKNNLWKKECNAQTMMVKKGHILEEIETIKRKLQQAKINYENTKYAFSVSKTELKNEELMLEVFKQDLVNSNNTDDIEKVENEFQSIKSEIFNYVKMRSDINNKLDGEYTAEAHMLKQRIKRLENIIALKLELIQCNYPEVYTAMQLLRENKNWFTGRVYNPILIELNVLDPKNAKYLESIIPLRDLLAFTCENKDDVPIMTNEFCVKNELSINVLYSSNKIENQYSPHEPIANIKKFGFTAYLIDLIEGPSSILNYLCSVYNLHKIPIGTENVNQWTENIPKHINQYFGGDQRYTISTSKYSKESSLMQSHVADRNILQSIDNNEIEVQKKRLGELFNRTDTLKNERFLIEAKINDLELARADLMIKKRDLKSKLSRLEEVKEQFKRQKRKVTLLKDSIADAPEMEGIFQNSFKQHLQTIINLQYEKIDVLKLYEKALGEKKSANITVSVFQRQTEDINDIITKGTNNIKRMLKIVDSSTKTIENLKLDYHKKISGMKEEDMPTNKQFRHRNIFNTIPDNIEKLKESINECSARLECMSAVDQTVISEYNSRSAAIKTLADAISENLNLEKDIEGEMYCIYESWYPQICNIVNSLNKHFGDFMASMHYVGEVVLSKQNDYDFDSYGIQINVQYRKDLPLQALNRQLQSGGERAVAIAVYTLSLQHITHVPFCCVDELNQGMDAKNERKIFEMIINETTKNGRPQYFFVTPKVSFYIMVYFISKFKDFFKLRFL